MTTFATRFRAFPSSDALPRVDGDHADPASSDASAPTMDASMTPVLATLDASMTPMARAASETQVAVGVGAGARAGVANDTSRPAIVHAAMRTQDQQLTDAARYDVKSVLGRGGMGEVRLCHDLRIGRDVAIKVAHASRADDGMRARFLRESRVQGQLEHPTIVPVYDLEVFDDGSAFFAMKRVKGQTLGSILAALKHGNAEAMRRYPMRKLLAAFNSVCLAVDFAHTKGVVHRDIKPGNIMLGDFGEVYLLDWGLAKVLHESEGHSDDPAHDAHAVPANAALKGSEASDAQTATVVGSVLGTPGYMAPEQIDASIGAITPAADVYALGAVLFEILALERYIDAKDYVEATIATLQGVERRPSKCARVKKDVAARIAPALDELCARALAKLPADRSASARALHDAVDAHLAGEQDLERRRSLSAAHLDSAAKQASDDAGRATALKELGSAIALDPDNADARRALVTLLTTSPREIPPAVKQRIADDDAERVRSVARMRATSGLAIVPFIFIAMLFGVREAGAFWLGVVCLVVTSLASLALSRSTRPSRVLQVVSHLAFMVMALTFTRVAGPFVIVPALLVAYCVELQMHPNRGERLAVLASCCFTVLVSFLIDRSGLVAPSYTVADGGILIHSRLIGLDDAAMWFIAIAGVAAIITPSVFVMRIRRELAAAERQLHLQAWQLTQIVPKDAPT